MLEAPCMKRLHFLLVLAGVFCLCQVRPLAGAEPAGRARDKIRVLVVTGGHDFEHEQFFQLFKDNPDIRYEAVEHPKAYEMFKASAAGQYDVIVLYDFNQKISDEAKTDFVARLKEGKGLVVLHHAIATYPD